MNSKRILSISCAAAVILTASFAFGAPHRGGHFSSMRGGQTFSRSGTGTWSGGNWSGRNWSGGSWSGGNWSGDWRHHRHHHNDIVFIGDFGFPLWWGWGWYPWSYPYGYYGYGYGYPYGYPYGYGGYEYGYDYGQSGYGYGYGTKSRVAQLQRRLARAGYYHGAIDGIMGPQTRRAIRAYEREHGYVG
jgi:hypothetical protein